MDGPELRFSIFPNHPELRKKYFEIFDCDLCGTCCNFFFGVPVTKEDVQRLARHLGTYPSEFKEKYCVYDIPRRIWILKHPCAFLQDGKCTVHDYRPDNCRAYPLINALCTDNIEHLGVRLNCPRALPALRYLETLLIESKPVMK
jgi:Fe-S-cluster containining protein